jgi:hypothetical protein
MDSNQYNNLVRLLNLLIGKTASGADITAALSSIVIDADAINVNTADLEILVGTTNTTLTDNSQKTRITDGTDTLAINADGSLNATVAPAVSARTFAVNTYSAASGNITAGDYSMSIVASSDFSGTVGGVTFPASATLSISSPLKDTLPAIAYTRAAGTLTVYSIR